MVSCFRIGVPILIGAAGWGREICLYLRRLFMRIRLIEPIVAIQGNVTKAVADLTQWSVGLLVVGREATTRGGSTSSATKRPGSAS
jgi:hypothetical protein